jgi:hypothetical protein
MSDGYLRNREFFGNLSGSYRVAATDNGLVTLVAAIPLQTIFLQGLHIEVTTLTGSELWTFQDGAGTPIPLIPSVSAAAVAHFDFDFGPGGVPLTEAQAFVLNVTGAVGAIGWLSWEAYKKLTLGAPPKVG